MFDLPLAEVAKNPEKYIPQLEGKQQEAKDRLRGISGALRELRKIQASYEHLEYIQEHGVPRPREASDRRGSGDSEDYGDRGEGSERRKDRVLRLLSQTPERVWKAKEIAAALDIDNIKSLRASLDEFARAGVIRKDLENSTYSLGPQGYQESF